MLHPQKIIALKSLITPQHAENIEPSIFSITWNLGKRCNYDCSYCPPTLHDWASPHIEIEQVQKFVTKLDAWAILNKKTIKYSLSGGEPFVHPKILEILATIRSSKTCEEIFVATTNGSLPLELYEKSLQYLSNLTISMHFERTEAEIDSIVDRIIALTVRNPDKMINAQVMMLPGKFDFIQKILHKFGSYNVKYTIRRIRPKKYDSEEIFGISDERKLLKSNIDADRNAQSRSKIKLFLQENLNDIYDKFEYYSKEELEWMSTNIPQSGWQNIGVWDDRLEYTEHNSDDLVNRNMNRFKGWHCYIGVDCAAITSEGFVLRGACGNDPPLFHIDDFENFDLSPTKCQLNLCLSNPDLTTRKAMIGYDHLITDGRRQK